MAEQDQKPSVESKPESNAPAPAAPAGSGGAASGTPAAPSAAKPAGPPAESQPASAPRGGQRGFGGGRGGRGGGFGGRGGRGGRDRRRPDDGPQDDMEERVIFINRSSKVVKGGRRFNFSALVAVGDRKGKVGLGMGKAREVVEAIRKGNENARANLEKVALLDNTIPHEVLVDYDGAKVLLRPASPGTGVIAGKTVRAVLELAGLRDVLSKSLGSNNAANVAKATMCALRQLRLRDEIYQLRGLPLDRSKNESETPAPTTT